MPFFHVEAVQSKTFLILCQDYFASDWSSIESLFSYAISILNIFSHAEFHIVSKAHWYCVLELKLIIEQEIVSKSLTTVNAVVKNLGIG